MGNPFNVLILGTVLFLIAFMVKTSTITTGGSDPAAGALSNSVRILEGLQFLGVYMAFAVIVLGRAMRKIDSSLSQEELPHGRPNDA